MFDSWQGVVTQIATELEQGDAQCSILQTKPYVLVIAL